MTTEIKRRQKKCVVAKLQANDEVKIDGLWHVVISVEAGGFFTALKTKRGSKEFTHSFVGEKLLTIIRAESA